jgi:hypothetical protein
VGAAGADPLLAKVRNQRHLCLIHDRCAQKSNPPRLDQPGDLGGTARNQAAPCHGDLGAVVGDQARAQR